MGLLDRKPAARGAPPQRPAAPGGAGRPTMDDDLAALLEMDGSGGGGSGGSAPAAAATPLWDDDWDGDIRSRRVAQLERLHPSPVKPSIRNTGIRRSSDREGEREIKFIYNTMHVTLRTRPFVSLHVHGVVCARAWASLRAWHWHQCPRAHLLSLSKHAPGRPSISNHRNSPRMSESSGNSATSFTPVVPARGCTQGRCAYPSI